MTKGTWEGDVTQKITNLEKDMGDVKECLDHHGKTLQQINITMLDMRDKWQEAHDSNIELRGEIKAMCLRAENSDKKVDSHVDEHVWFTLKDLTKILITLSGLPIAGAFFAWMFKLWPFSLIK